MDQNLIIDREKCIMCKICKRVYSPFVLRFDGEGFPFEKYPHVFSISGHWISACPSSAIQFKDLGFQNAEEINPNTTSIEHLINLLGIRG